MTLLICFRLIHLSHLLILLIANNLFDLYWLFTWLCGFLPFTFTRHLRIRVFITITWIHQVVIFLLRLRFLLFLLSIFGLWSRSLICWIIPTAFRLIGRIIHLFRWRFRAIILWWATWEGETSGSLLFLQSFILLWKFIQDFLFLY